MDVHLATAWEEIADALPHQPALINGDTVRTWAEFDDRASKLAGALAERGIRRGDVVAINTYNCNEFLETHFAVLKLRAVPVSINYRYVKHELAYLLTDSEARAIVYHSAFRDRIDEIARDVPLLTTRIEVQDAPPSRPCSPADVDALSYEALIAAHEPAPRIERPTTDVVMSYTGGTTGLPKGVRGAIGSAHRALEGNSPAVLGLPESVPKHSLVAAARWLHTNGTSVRVLPLSPLMHSTAMVYGCVPALSVGGTVVTLTSRRLDVEAALETIERWRATCVVVVGDAIARPLVDALDARAQRGEPADLSSLRTMASAGVVWSVPVKRAVLEHAPHIALIDSCGSTEGAWIGTSIARHGDDLFSERFVAAPGLRIIDPRSGEPIEPGTGEAGLIACPAGADYEYFKDPAKSAQTYRTIEGSPYIVPGDHGTLSRDGVVVLLGRGSSTINTGGEKVHPEEVENVIRGVTGVADCLVIGLPDPRWMQRVTALVQVSPGACVTSESITSATRAALADYKTPKDVIFVEDVPRHPNGKADFSTAQKLAEASLEAATAGDER